MTRSVRLAACGVLLVAAAAGSAQSPAPFVPWANKFFQKDNPPAVLVHDFGTVPKGTLLVHKFTVTNIYEVPVQVIDVRKSCTCLEAYPPARVLRPHESAELTVTMNTDKFTGPNAQTFFITFGPQYVSTAVVQLKATSRADVTVTPGVVNFGVVAQGSKPAQTVGVKYAGRQRDWRVVGVVPPDGPLDVQLAAGSGEYRLTVGLKADAPAGAVSEVVSLRTNDPSAPVIQVAVTGVVQAPVSVSPAAIRFDDVKLGGPGAVQKVVVRATRPFTIQPVADDGDGLTVETFPGAAPVQVVTVRYQPKAAGVLRKAVTLQTDLGPATLGVEAVGVP